MRQGLDEDWMHEILLASPGLDVMDGYWMGTGWVLDGYWISTGWVLDEYWMKYWMGTMAIYPCRSPRKGPTCVVVMTVSGLYSRSRGKCQVLPTHPPIRSQ